MDKEWKILMETSSTATWFQSEEAYECYRACSAWLIPFLVQVHRGKRLVGSVLGYVTKERCRLQQFFTARAIIFGGPLLAKDINDDELTELLRRVQDECQKGKAIYIEIRNFGDYSLWREAFEKAGWTYCPHYDIHIDCSNKDAMMGKIHESKLRAVRKAQAEGKQVVEATTEEQVRVWYKQLKHLYKTKVHRPLWPVEFFLTVWKVGYGKLLIQITGDRRQVTGGMFCVKDEKTLYEWYICGQTMVTYGALEWAADQGLSRFDLMGAGEPGIPYGVRDFKMQFGGELKELGRYQFISKPIRYKLGKMIVSCLTPVNR